MTTLAKTALVGTARHPGALSTSNDIECIIPAHCTGNKEEHLLLLAGVSSVYHQAGQLPVLAISALQPAPQSSRVLRSQKLGQLLKEVIRSSRYELLIEFLSALQSAQRELPYEILPMALNATDSTVRLHLQPVLGERGRWLSTFKPRWEWVGAGVSTVTTEDRTALRRAWDEGKLSQRALALSVMRGADPTEARQWLEETLPQEKADARAELVQQLQHGLHLADEPLLKRLLNDRSDRVAQIAATLLRQLPGSQLIQRMTQRSQGLLQLSRGKLVAHPPDDLPGDWQRDGVAVKVPTGRGKKAYWLSTVLGMVPVEHWVAQFQMQPEQLIAAVAGDPYEQDVVAGWTEAIKLVNDDNAARLSWTHTLWNYWLTHWQQDKKKSHETLSRLVALLKLFPSTTAEKNVLPFLVLGRLDLDALTMLLMELPRPWSNAFATQYLQLAKEIINKGVIDQAFEWGKTLEIAAIALPRSILTAALTPWLIERTGQKSWTANALAQLVERFTEVVKLRHRFFEELHSDLTQTGAKPANI